ncbi:MAG: hypothetical protein VCA73_16860 [Roseibacillus sp.]
MKGTDTMATLTDYNQFDGHHYETGTVHNYLAFTGARAPHTRNPYSEALLLGVSGGIVTGYFNLRLQGVRSPRRSSHPQQLRSLRHHVVPAWR